MSILASVEASTSVTLVARLTRWLLIGLCLILAASAAAVGYYCHRARVQVLSVQSNSMLPQFRKGDAVVVRRTAFASLRQGQVVSYLSPRSDQVIITHRLVGIDSRTGQLRTKGDHLASADPPFSGGRLVGQALAVLPRFGLVLDFLRRPIGLILAVYVPAVLLVCAEFFGLAVERPSRATGCSLAILGGVVDS